MKNVIIFLKACPEFSCSELVKSVEGPYRLMVRTLPSQGKNQSSILCRVTASFNLYISTYFHPANRT